MNKGFYFGKERFPTIDKGHDTISKYGSLRYERFFLQRIHAQLQCSSLTNKEKKKRSKLFNWEEYNGLLLSSNCRSPWFESSHKNVDKSNLKENSFSSSKFKPNTILVHPLGIQMLKSLFLKDQKFQQRCLIKRD